MNLTVETIAALRAQGLPAEAVLDAVQAALTARIERDRESARLRQQKSRAARRPRRVVSATCHSDSRDPSPDKKKNPPDPLKEKTNPILAKPPSSASAQTLPADWQPQDAHVDFVWVEFSKLLSLENQQDASRGYDTAEQVFEFAQSFVKAQAMRMRGWATTWHRTHPDWHGRFAEWLRIEVQTLRRQRAEPTILRTVNVGGHPATFPVTLNDEVRRYILQQMGVVGPDTAEDAPETI